MPSSAVVDSSTSSSSSPSSSLTLHFSSYFGGTAFDSASGIVVDSSGNFYVIGSTFSPDFPLINSLNSTFNSTFGNIFISKFNSSGSLIFSTLFGSGVPSAIALDPSGFFYVTGSVFSPSLPTKNAFNSTFGGASDGFLAKFSLNGSLIFSTYFGGNNSDTPSGLAVDSSGNVYITGSTNSPNFPTENAFNTTYSGNTDVFLAKFSSSGNLVFSTFVGGSNYDYASSLTLDSSSNCYIVGYTYSSNFPVKNAFQTISGGGADGFISKFSSTGQLDFSTYLGGEKDDILSSIGVSSGDIFVTGATISPNFPEIIGYNGTGTQLFLAKLSLTGSLFFISTFGGHYENSLTAFAIGPTGDFYIAGRTFSKDFPVTNAYNSTFGGGNNPLSSFDCFLVKLDQSGHVLFSTFLGLGHSRINDITIDKTGNIFLCGETVNPSIPLKNAYSSNFSGTPDAFIVVLSPPENFNLLGFLNQSFFIFLYLLVIFVILSLFLFLSIEYRSYRPLKKDKTKNATHSFKNFLLQKFRFNHNDDSEFKHVSDKTFELLESIEQDLKTPK